MNIDFIGILFVVGFVVGIVSFYRIFSEVETNIYQKMYPLDTKVKVKVNRERLNFNYFNLSESGKLILEKTATCDDVWLTRKVRNELVITIDLEEIVILSPQGKKITNNWVKFLANHRFFTKIPK